MTRLLPALFLTLLLAACGPAIPRDVGADKRACLSGLAVPSPADPRAGQGRNRHGMRKKRSSRVSAHSSRRIASRVLPPLRTMYVGSPGRRVIAGGASSPRSRMDALMSS